MHFHFLSFFLRIPCFEWRELWILDCPYGDRASWCSGVTARECYSNEETCCQTCKSLVKNKDDHSEYTRQLSTWVHGTHFFHDHRADEI